MVHGMSHPSGRATKQQIAWKFVWSSMNKDITAWVRECLHCQRSKITRYNRLTPERFPIPAACFDHVHLDIIGLLSPSRGFRYCLILIDHFSRWPKAVPIPDITADTVARFFFTTWILRFGSPKIITTDQVAQFESSLFKAITRLIDTKRTRTTAYHPESMPRSLSTDPWKQQSCAKRLRSGSYYRWCSTPVVRKTFVRQLRSFCTTERSGSWENSFTRRTCLTIRGRLWNPLGDLCSRLSPLHSIDATGRSCSGICTLARTSS